MNRHAAKGEEKMPKVPALTKQEARDLSHLFDQATQRAIEEELAKMK